MKKILSLLILAVSLKQAAAQSWSWAERVWEGFWGSFAGIELNSMHFQNTEVGYVAGNRVSDNLPPSRSNGVIFKTVDGGQTFTQQYGSQLPPATAALRDIHFFNQSTGIAVGDSGLVLRTFNGGATWEKLPAWNTINNFKVLLITNQKAFMLGRNSSGTYLLESIDRERWIKRSLGNNIANYCDIYFLSGNFGFISTMNQTGQGGLYKTTDAGNTWDLVSDNTFILYDLSFPTPLIGYASVYSQYMYAQTNTRYIAKTVDGGLNWNILDSTISETNYTDYQDVWHTKKIVFLNQDIGYAIRNNEIIMTQDGGLTWSVSQSFPYRLYSLSFPSANIGYLALVNVNYSSMIYKTTNGGGLVLKGKNKQLSTMPQRKPN